MNFQHSHYISGQWTESDGDQFASIDPATQESVWQGSAADGGAVDAAAVAAREALHHWANASLDDRIAFMHKFKGAIESRKAQIAEAIARETGKPRWECEQEATLMATKVQVSIDAYHDRRAEVVKDQNNLRTALRYKPHGVVAVLGPFNLPGHLPNGHIIPALIAGNTVVFKPSERTPGVGDVTMQAWHDVGLPPGVVNMVQGMRGTGESIVRNQEFDGIYFTGGFGAGMAIADSLKQFPHRIIALEMGGNNPLVVGAVSNIDAAALTIIQSAFITAGQRCTCARRLILLPEAPVDALLDRVSALISNMNIGAWNDEPQPFIGPVIAADVADRLLAAEQSMLERAASSLVAIVQLDRSPAMLRPGMIDVTNMRDREDAEFFGPLLQVIYAKDFHDAMREANNTAFGLSAGLLADDEKIYEAFLREIRAGIVNWNRPTTGASGALPFGGIGKSGNHRPSGYWAVDYCSFPVASMESNALELPDKLPPGITM